MALADILKKIIAESDTQIATIKSDCDAQKEAATKDLKQAEVEALAEVEAKQKAALEQVTKKTNSMARRANKNALGSAKRNLLDRSMAAFLESLNTINEAQKEVIFAALAQELVAGGTVVCNAQDKDLCDKVAPEGVTVEIGSHIESGFVYTKDTVTIDNTFASLVRSELKQDLETYFIDQLKLA